MTDQVSGTEVVTLTFRVTGSQPPPEPDPDTCYALVCRDCADQCAEPLVLPFGTPEARGRWAAAHRDATGHGRWWVKDHKMAKKEGGASGA